jgi:hypothetical protein
VNQQAIMIVVDQGPFGMIFYNLGDTPICQFAKNKKG